MNEIGGLFLFEQLPEKENGYIERIGGDVRYLMSGRCGIYYALEDLKLNIKTKKKLRRKRFLQKSLKNQLTKSLKLEINKQ